MAGSATFTTVPSMNTTADPAMHAINVSRFSRVVGAGTPEAELGSVEPLMPQQG